MFGGQHVGLPIVTIGTMTVNLSTFALFDLSRAYTLIEPNGNNPRGQLVFQRTNPLITAVLIGGQVLEFKDSPRDNGGPGQASAMHDWLMKSRESLGFVEMYPYWFNPLCLATIDSSAYQSGGAIVLSLIGGYTFAFNDAAADRFAQWFKEALNKPLIHRV